MLTQISLLLLQVLFPLGCLIAAGAIWSRIYRDESALFRQQLNALILNVLSPALVFAVIAATPLDTALIRAPMLAAVAIIVVGALEYVLLWHSPLGATLRNETKAALMICGMFGNVFFFGYPVLTFLFGPDAARYPAYIDLLGSIPLVWTLGVWIATKLGASHSEPVSLWRVMATLPPVWGFALGLAYRALGLELDPLIAAMHWIGQTAVPLASFVLGLAIPWHALRPNRAVMVIVSIKLIAMPAILLAMLALAAAPRSEADLAVLIEAGMPTMAMGVMLADRFGLDVNAAALTTAWTTLLFCVSLPFWLMLLGIG